MAWWLIHPTIADQDVASAYKKSLNLLKKTVDGAGPLITNHSVAIMASIGLLPMWYMTTALIPTDSKYMRHFKRTFELPDLDDNVMAKIGNRITALAHNRLGFDLNLRVIENALCKYYRVVADTANDDQWNDMIMASQPLVINVNEDKWTVVRRDGSVFLGSGPLIKSLPLGRHIQCSTRYAQVLSITATKLPSLPVIQKWVVPPDVVFNRNRLPLITELPNHINSVGFGSEARQLMNSQRSFDASQYERPVIPRRQHDVPVIPRNEPKGKAYVIPRKRPIREGKAFRFWSRG